MDRIVAASPEWFAFARANGAAALVPEAVIGRSLWTFITDHTTFEIYRQLLLRARSGREIAVHLRCDIPSARRVYELRLHLLANNAVEFSSELISHEPRTPQPILQSTKENTAALVRMCSWCQRIAHADGRWFDLEDALMQIPRLADPQPPQLTHGICPTCHERMTQMLKT